jgi:hypothetical protein
VILTSAISARAPFWRFLCCVALVLALEFLLLVVWFALPESPLRSLGASSRDAVAGFAHRLRDGAILARLHFIGFQYLAISLVVLFVGWLFWIGRSGWRFGILNAAVFAAHAALVIVSFGLYRFASVYVFLAVMLAVILLAARGLWLALIPRKPDPFES